MSGISKKRISIAFGLYSTVITVAYIIFLIANREYIPEIGPAFADGLITSISLTFLGVLLTTRRPENRISWLLVLIAAMRQTSYLYNSSLILSLKGSEEIYWQLISNLWPALSGLTYTLLAYVIVLFPTGRLPSRRWRPASILLAMQTAITIGLLLLLGIDLARSFAAIRDTGGMITLVPAVSGGPYALIKHVRQIPELDFMWPIAVGIAFIMVLLALGSLTSQFKTGSRIVRQQIKWVIFVVVLWAASIFLVFLPLGISVEWIALVSPLIPISIAVAILRYRLFDIDVIIHRTAIYALLTGLLVIIYFGSVTLLQSLVSAVSGPESPLMIVLSTLLIAAIFNPLRRRIQGFIDRRFYRQKYNTELTLTHFAETARDEVDLEALAAELTSIIHETLRPVSVTLWLSSHGGED